MPRIRRWFPMPQDINRDPEFWEFRELIGPRAEAIWEEILSIADRNDGFLPGLWEAYPRLLAAACHSTRSRVQVAMDWLTTPRGKDLLPWVTVESKGVARVTNHAEYHRTREPDKIPQGKQMGFPPSEPSLPTFPKDLAPAPSAALDKGKSESGRKLEGELKAISDILFRSDPVRFGKLVKWIWQKQKAGCMDSDIASALRDLKSREEKLGPVDDWWAYLGSNGNGQSAVARSRTRRLEAENNEQKKPGPVKLGDLAGLAKLAALSSGKTQS